MKRAATRNRAFKVALVISGMFHLSMVSVFSIMIWFPRHDLKYFRVEIVRQQMAAGQEPETPVRSQPLRLRSREELFSAEEIAGAGDGSGVMAEALGVDSITGPEAPAGFEPLPPIDLPKIEFAQLDRLRTRQESLKIRSEFSELFDARPRDSWELFSEELRGLGRRLTSGLTGAAAQAPPRRPVRVSTPAPGFGIYVQWMSAPYDRQLLFSPPVQVLWEMNAVEVAAPIALAFTVNPQGKVVDIQIPVEDEQGLSTAIGTALLNYRFAPLREGDKLQQGTLLVAPEAATGPDGLGGPLR